MSRANCRLQRRILERLEQSPEHKRIREVLVGAEGLPANAEWLSKNVRTIAAATEGPTVDPGWRGKERILKLNMETTVGTAGTVGGSPASTNGTVGTDGKYEDGDR